MAIREQGTRLQIVAIIQVRDDMLWTRIVSRGFGEMW